MRERGGELVTTDGSAVATETFLDAIVVEDGQSGPGLTNSVNANESDRSGFSPRPTIFSTSSPRPK